MNKIKIIFSIVILLGAIAMLIGQEKKVTVPEVMIGKEVVCPVTGKTFKITKDTPVVEYNGQIYHFCCPGCDDKFLADPGKYIKTGTLPNMEQPDTNSEQRDTSNVILYWTCSMHPTVRADKPGDCPICGMELIPVRKGEENSIKVNEETQTMLGIASQPVEEMSLVKELNVPGRVAKDQELYLAQQEYISSYNFGSEVLEGVKLRFGLMGFPESELSRLAEQEKPDESLIFPSEHRAWFFAQVYEKDLAMVRTGQSVEVSFPAYQGKKFLGRIVAIEPNVDPQTRSTKARIVVEHPMEKLSFDMYADIKIKIPLGRKLAIPYTSIIDTGTRRLVYLEVGQGQYEPRAIETGFEAQDYVQVIAGLKPGDRVVTEGNFILDSQSTLMGGQALLYGAGEEVKTEPQPTPHRH